MICGVYECFYLKRKEKEHKCLAIAIIKWVPTIFIQYIRLVNNSNNLILFLLFLWITTIISLSIVMIKVCRFYFCKFDLFYLSLHSCWCFGIFCFHMVRNCYLMYDSLFFYSFSTYGWHYMMWLMGRYSKKICLRMKLSI